MSRKDLNAVAHCVQEPKANPTGNVFEFLYRSSKAAVAVSAETNSRVKDQADVLLAKAKIWPTGYPDNMKSKEKATRIHFRLTNAEQCRDEMAHILEMYRTHIIETNSDLVSKYPQLDRYSMENPLAIQAFDRSDTLLFKNATKLSASAPATAASATTSTSSQPDSSGSPSPSSKAKKKAKKKKKDSSKTATAEPVLSVLTEFAIQLNRLGKELYTLLRANLFRFIDTSCNSIVKYKVNVYERKKGLKGLERLDPDK